MTIILRDPRTVNELVSLEQATWTPAMYDARRVARMKGWRCPACRNPLTASDLGRYEQMIGDGRWYVRGDCRHCHRRVQFSKSGSQVVPGDAWVGVMVPVPTLVPPPIPATIIRKRRD